MMMPPATEKEAFEALESILDGENWLEGAEGQHQAVAILQRSPRLATLRLGASMRKPLHHFLLSSASRHLDVIERVYRLEMAAAITAGANEPQQERLVGDHNEKEATALHAACMSQYATDEVVQFIFRTNPFASLARNHPLGLSPLAFLFTNTDGTVRNPSRLSTLAMLLQAYPGCVKQDNNDSRGEIDLLATAMSVGCSQQVYELLWEHYPKPAASFRLCSDFHAGTDDRLGLPEAHMLCQMLPYLTTTLVCQPQQWTSTEAMNLLCQQLTHSTTSLVELDISLTSAVLDSQSCHLWTTLLQTNRTLRSLKFQAETHNMVKLSGRRTLRTFRSLVSDRPRDDGPLLNSIFSGLAANSTVQELQLSCFKFPTDGPSFVAADSISCSLRKVQFVHCYMGSYDWLQHCFMPLVATSLQDLTMTFRQDPRTTRPPDMTHTLVQFLDRCLSLQSITIGKVDPSLGAVATNVDDLLQALQRNTSLRSFSIDSLLEQPRDVQRIEVFLKSGRNATLQEILNPTFGACLYSSWKDCSDDGTPPKSLGRIPYFLLWNKFGRHTVRQSNASKHELVQILGRVNQSSLQELPAAWRHDLILDLLLETPSVWAMNGACRSL
jgi:hypothetical protein